MGATHSGVLLRMLLTKVDTGWKTMFSVGWMSLTASWVGTSAKSSHFLMASSPSRMAGILKDKTVGAKGQQQYVSVVAKARLVSQQGAGILGETGKLKQQNALLQGRVCIHFVQEADLLEEAEGLTARP